MNLMPHRRAPRRTRALAPLAVRAGAAVVLLALPTAFFAARAARAQNGETGLSVPMAVSWKYTSAYYGNNPASPVVSGGAAYFASGNRVYAVDAQSGALKWQYPSDTRMETFVLATPAVADGKVFFGAGDGLHALDAEKGTTLWHFQLRNGVSTAPLTLGENIYFGGQNGRLYAVSAQSGNPVGGNWRQGIPAGGDISSDIVASNNVLYFLTNGLNLTAVNPTTGQARWTLRLPAQARGNSQPLVYNDTIFVAAGNSLSAWRAGTATQRWYQQLPSDAATAPAMDENGTTYVITTNRNIFAVNRDGRGIWRQAARVDFDVTAQPILSGDLLIVGTLQGGVYAFDKATGALKWNYRIAPSARDANAMPSFANVAARPVAAGGALFVLTDDGALTSFRPDAPDSVPPTVTTLLPTPGETINGRPPLRLGAKIEDIGSGLNLSTLTVKLDDQLIPRSQEAQGRQTAERSGFTYNEDTRVIEYITVERDAGQSNALSNGLHSMTVSVSDWMGNVQNKVWNFYVDNTLPRRARNTGNQPGQPGGSGGVPSAPGDGGKAGE